MKKINLIIAGIPLNISYHPKDSVLSFFKRFTLEPKSLNGRVWHLESQEVERDDCDINSAAIKQKISELKERLRFTKISPKAWKHNQERFFFPKNGFSANARNALASFFLIDPVEINLKKKQITRFYKKRRGHIPFECLDRRLVSFCYSQILGLNNGALLHCACVVKENKAYLFFAPSSGGKSTVAELSKKYTVLGDDIIAVRKINNKFYAFATAWTQKKFIKPAHFLIAEIRAVFFLNKARRISFKKLEPERALMKTLSNSVHFLLYTPSPLARKIFFTLAGIFKKTPAYEMYFKKNQDFWQELDTVVNESAKK